MEARDIGIPPMPRSVFLLCMGCPYRQAMVCLSLWLKSRSEQASHPRLALPLASSAVLYFRENRLTSSLQVQWAIKTSDRQILKILDLILDKPSNICSLHKSLKHLGSTKSSINLKQYGFLMIFFPCPASVGSSNI